jgi:hypothetical protein
MKLLAALILRWIGYWLLEWAERMSPEEVRSGGTD